MKELDSMEKMVAEIESLRLDKAGLQERLDRISEITAAIIYMLDVDGKFTFVNKAVHEILHFTPDELIGKHFSTIMSREEYERVSRAFVLPRYSGRQTGTDNAPRLFDERRTGERRTRNLEVKLLTKERKGVKILVGDVAGIIAVEGAYDLRKVSENRNKATGFLGSQGIIFDITKYKKAERERMELQRRLFETQKMDAIGRLAGKVAHDLNNKLGSIIGCTEVILQEFVSGKDELRMYMETVLSASRHAAELSNRLMEFSCKDDNQLSEIDIHDLVNNVIELVRPTVEGSICIHKKMDALSSGIIGNPNQLQNAILNIVSNACDAMTIGGGELTFQTADIKIDQDFICSHSFAVNPGDFVLLSISDTGTGMDEKTRRHLFEPFFTTKAVGKGIGLGLASVRDALKNHGGFIDVETNSGKGSQFKLYFPCKSAGSPDTTGDQ